LQMEGDSARMLNQTSEQRIGRTSQWCVGEPPLQWDVSFGARLAEKIKQIFWRDAGDRPVKVDAVKREVAGVVLRKAA
jgi:hypothetical protein